MTQNLDYLDVIICGYLPNGMLWEVRSYTKMVPKGKWQGAYSWAILEAAQLNKGSSQVVFKVHKYGLSGSLDQYVQSLLSEIRENKNEIPF